MANSVLTELLKRISKVETAYPLQQLSLFSCGGSADYYTEAGDLIELATAVKAALDLSLPYVVIAGAGSTLFADGGFAGLVIRNVADRFTVAADRSQVVVDSGLSLDRLVTTAASRGLGGITRFHGQGGSVGAALLADYQVGGQYLRSFVRYVTVLQPASRLDRDATVNRYRADWLYDRPAGESSKILRNQAATSDGRSGAILLTAVLQLTSLRPESIHHQLRLEGVQRPAKVVGPLFIDPPGGDASELLRQAQVTKLRLLPIQLHPHQPNLALAHGKFRTAREVWDAILMVQQQVQERTGVLLQPAISRIGPW